MIIEYQRPKTIDEALILLARENPKSFPLGGGTVINNVMDMDYAVIDLQELGLGNIDNKGNAIQVGATTTLQQLLEYDGLPKEMYKVVELESTYNLRQMATLAGTLVTATGRSHLSVALLAMDATLEFHTIIKKIYSVKLGDWLPLRKGYQSNELITGITIPGNVHFAYEFIARSPADQPIVSAAVAKWNSGRTRLVLGGWGNSPILALDGPNSDGITDAAKNANNLAGDEWASAEYRREMAGILSSRCLVRINATHEV